MCSVLHVNKKQQIVPLVLKIPFFLIIIHALINALWKTTLLKAIFVLNVTQLVNNVMVLIIINAPNVAKIRIYIIFHVPKVALRAFLLIM